VKEQTLTVAGAKKPDEKERQYLHRGIAARNFERRFQLADHVEVKGADLQDGLLHIELVRNVPERLKPRTIAIGSVKAAQARQVEAAPAA
jgi:molecular chaperone IbpA